MTTTDLYRKHKAGGISREKFLYEVRRDENLPYITNLTSYADAIQILKNKSLVSESPVDPNRGEDITDSKLLAIISRYIKEPEEAKRLTNTDPEEWPEELEFYLNRDTDYAQYASDKDEEETSPEIDAFHSGKINEAVAPKKKTLTIDNVNPYEYRHGLQHELCELDDYSDEALEKAKVKVLKNLTKDPNFYTTLLNQKKSHYEFKTPESQTPNPKLRPSGHLKKEAKKDEKSNVKITLGKKEAGKKKPKGIKIMPDKGVTGTQKTIKEGIEISDLKKGDTVEYEGNKYKIGDFDTAGGVNLVYLNTMDGKPAEDSKGRYKKVHKSRVKSPQRVKDILTNDLEESEGQFYAPEYLENKYGKEIAEKIEAEIEDLDPNSWDRYIGNVQKLIDAGYSESDAEDFADEFEQGGVKCPQRVKDILTNKVDESNKLGQKYSTIDKDVNGFTHSFAYPDSSGNESKEGLEKWVSMDSANRDVHFVNSSTEAHQNAKSMKEEFRPGVDLGNSFDKFKQDISGNKEDLELSDENAFEDLMKKYDWYAEMSDDSRKYDAQQELHTKLKALGKKIGASKAIEIFNRYAPKDRKSGVNFFTEDKHAKLKETLKAALRKEIINPKDILSAKTTGDIVNIPDQDTMAKKAAQNAKINFRTYKA